MRIGLLDRRVTIQSNTPVTDGAGQVVESWSNVATVWMRVKPSRGSEKYVAHQDLATSVTTFIARHRTGVTVKHRLLFDGKTWDIHDVREIRRKNGLEIDASARAEP